MRRIVDPLMAMGARIGGEHGEGEEIRAPLVIAGPPGGAPLHPAEYEMPMASAQVKSAVLLAGLYARGRTVVIEPAPTRDHTERMLAAFGADVAREGRRIAITGGPRLRGTRVDVPGDLSAAIFFLVAALITPDSEVRVRGVGVNPTRTGALDILRAMGADLAVADAGERGGEPVADLVARSSRLRATQVRGDVVARAIDEFPILAVAAAFAEGTTRIRDAAELRTKETDRIEAMVTELARLGARARAVPDGMDIEGGAPLTGARCDSHGDHRVAMALAVAALGARGETVIGGAGMVATSFPGFRDALGKVIVPR
jgi:3-phosphoshikimate 1-carboxyvinyltransferase